MEGKQVPVDPDPVFVIEDDGLDTFLDGMGTTITGRQAIPEEERQDLPVAFVHHRRTCTWADKPAPRRVERETDADGLSPSTPQHTARLKPYDHKAAVEMLAEARREYEGAMDRVYTVATLMGEDAREMEREARLLAAATTMTCAAALYHVANEHVNAARQERGGSYGGLSPAT